MTAFFKYQRLFDAVVHDGAIVQTRLGPSRELLGVTFTFHPGLVVDRPRMNVQLGFMEWMLLVAGRFDVERIAAVAPKARLDLFTPQSAYGPRVKAQLMRVVETLATDPLSRRAVILLGSADESCTSGLPCTTSIQFLVRDRALETIVSMRSWDLHRGLPFDAMMFGGLAKVVARAVELPCGSVSVHAGSAHVYESDIGARPRWLEGSFGLHSSAPDSWSSLVAWASEEVDAAPWPDGRPKHVRQYKIPPKLALLDEFYANVEKSNDCWLWTGAITSNGYGKFGRYGRAHVVAHVLEVGELPPKTYALHTCDTPRCVRYSHIYPGTYADNAKDAVERGRHYSRTGADHPRYVRLPQDVYDYIAGALEEGRSSRDIAADALVGYKLVQRIRREAIVHD